MECIVKIRSVMLRQLGIRSLGTEYNAWAWDYSHMIRQRDRGRA
jgi:hypothetical protein